MTNRQYGSRGSRGSNTSSSTNSSPSPASSGNLWSKARGLNWSVLLISLAGLWLGAKMILIGGSISDGEIFFLMAITIIAAVLNSKLRFAATVIGVILLLNYCSANFNQSIHSARQAQLNPPGEMTPIVINRDGEYDLPARPLKVCFKQTGHPEKHWINQEVTIGDNWRVIEPYAKCHDLPSSLSGKRIKISLGVFGKQYTPDIKRKFNIGADVNNDYEYYQKMPGGQSGYPVIQAR